MGRAQLLRYFAQLLLVAVLYYITGRLGLLLAVPPGFATAIWPPSGIALAAVLVYGYRVWPGILIGSFILNLSIADSQLDSEISTMLALTIALGASLQAVFGAVLVGRFARFPNPLEQVRDVISVLLLGGVVGSLVNSSISTATLYGIGSVGGSAVGFVWLTWWVGDAIGVAVFAPFLLLLLAPENMISRGRKSILSFVLLLVFSLVVYTFIVARNLDMSARRASFEHVAHDTLNDVQRGFVQYMDLMSYVEGLFNASDFVSAQEFETFSEYVLKRQSSIRSLVWSPMVTNAERAGFEAEMRAQGVNDFSIVERDEEYHIRPAGERPVYFPVAYMAPPNINPQSLGTDNYASFDMNSAARRQAIDEAIAQRTDRISGRLILRSAGDAYGIAVYHPVFSEVLNKGGGEADRLAGFIIGSFKVSAIPNEFSAYIKSNGVEMTVMDVTGQAVPVMLYDSRTPDYKESHELLRTPVQSLIYIDDLSVGGRQWQFHFSESSARVAGLHGWGPWAVLVAGMAFTSLLSAFLLIVSGRTQVVQRLVDQKTREVASGLKKLEKANQELVSLYATTKEKEETFRLAMEHALVGEALVRPDGRFIKVNKALCDILGYSEQELVSIDYTAITHPDDLQRDNENVKSLLAGNGQMYRMEKRYIHKDGHIVWALLSVALVRDGQGQPLYFISQVDDISGLKMAEEEHHNLVEQLTQSNTELERFAYVASHDMQEPLRMIANFSELTVRESGDRLDDNGRQYLELVRSAARRMQDMVSDLLEYARVGNDQSAGGVVDIEMEIGHVLQNLAAPIARSGAEIVHGDLPRVFGNPVQITSLLQNLISNAVKYQAPGKHPLISVSSRDCGEMCEIVIADNGIGIPTSSQQKIFEPFTRLHSWQQYEGTGIGLAVCRKIVEKHGGQIWVVSEPGKGAEFHFTLKKAET